ncbi:MAG: hypothetical protein M0R80_01535 [Proteobacteria bacterium]|jgi:hypothetical protein|nr:hypothetical protein [Pseudomonadota bacterium]
MLTRIIKESLKRPNPGQFAIEPQANHALVWIACRDRFNTCYFTEDTEGFYVSHLAGDAVKVSAFMYKTEVILGVSYSEFAPTNRDYITWIAPSLFWKDNFIRRSLLTLLLRAGTAYDPKTDNYEEALYSNKYLKDSKPAVMRFLFGFTEFPSAGPDWSTGWWATFVNKSTEEVRRALVSKKVSEPSVVGQGSLWR